MKNFCVYCGKEVEIDIKEEVIKMKIEGIEFSYTGNVAYCKSCGEEVYIKELSDENIYKANQKTEKF